MATEKTAQGIRAFSADIVKLEQADRVDGLELSTPKNFQEARISLTRASFVLHLQ